MATRKSQIDQAIEKFDADIKALEHAREALITVRVELARKKTKARPQPITKKAAGE